MRRDDMADVDQAIGLMCDKSNQMIIDAGGSVDSLCLGFNVQLYKKTETSLTEDLECVGESMAFVFQYKDMDISKIEKDRDDRVGEMAFKVARALVQGIAKALHGKDFDMEAKQDGNE
jgi:hypothetical protein